LNIGSGEACQERIDLAFPIGLWDLSLWLAASSIELLVTSELLLELIGKDKIRLDSARLRNAGIACTVLFLVTIALRILEVVSS
jgi:hypothetical protein